MSWAAPRAAIAAPQTPPVSVAGGDTAGLAPPEQPLRRITLPITLDGDPSEDAWSQATIVETFYEIAPGDNAEPPVKTVGLIAYDSEFLYVGARCSDPEPAKIRAPYVDRDQVLNQDLVQIDLDARDEARWSMIFRVNPRGVQHDGVFDESTGADDYSPDFHWESAARITSTGWTAEMRIPLSTLRYRQRDPQTWRVTFFRLYPRKFRYQFVSAPIPRGSNCWLCHSLRLTGITGLPSGGGLAVTPFVTGNASGDPDQRYGAHGTAGADLKWLPQRSLAIDVAANPDFSQVESDAPQIGVNTRFALFYPEKRPFFLEGSDLWSSAIPVVSTRTITNPDWGVRVTGRPGNSSYTLLAAGDRGGGSLILPGAVSSSLAPQSDDALVLLGRLRQSLGRSSFGAVATYRSAPDGYFNGAAGADFQWYPGTTDHITGQALLSSTRDPGIERVTGHALHLQWDRSMPQLGWSILVQDLSSDFRADSGFVPQTGVRHAEASVGYAFYPPGFLRSVRPQVGFVDVREQDGPLVSQSATAGVAVDGAVQASVFWHPRDREQATDGRLFELGYWTASARFLPGRKLPYLLVTARYGDDLDLEGARPGTGSDVAVSAIASPTDRLHLDLTAEGRRLDVPSGGTTLHLFTALVARAKLNYAFTARTFTRLVVEWQEVDQREAGGARDSDVRASLLYGYRINWQSILYLGYDNGVFDAVAADRGRAHEVFLKVAYTFRPR